MRLQRQKEILRNKKERRFQRDASKLKSNPEALKEELKEVGSLILLSMNMSCQACCANILSLLGSGHQAAVWCVCKQVLDMEDDGKLNLTVRLKKRALQSAYDAALKKKKVREGSTLCVLPHARTVQLLAHSSRCACMAVFRGPAITDMICLCAVKSRSTCTAV